jgi:hypothetical protein
VLRSCATAGAAPEGPLALIASAAQTVAKTIGLRRSNLIAAPFLSAIHLIVHRSFFISVADGPSSSVGQGPAWLRTHLV